MNAENAGQMRKTAALLEVMGVLVVGNVAAGYLGPLIGIKAPGAIIQTALSTAEPDFIAMSVNWAQFMGFYYACLLLPAFGIGWWRRRWGLAHYGVTTAGKRVGFLVILGLIVFALVALPLKLLWVARRFIDLGSGSPYWELLDKTWTPSFWLFFAAASFALVPVLEELFYRGYCQTRLEEDFGGIGAIVIVALFMVLGHNQYHQLSILSIGTIVGMIPLALGTGYVFWRTRSIIPAVILHAAVNVPTKGIFDFLLPGLMIAVLILFRRQWILMVQDFYQQLKRKGWKTAAFGGTLGAIALVIGFETRPGIFIWIALAGLLIALAIEYWEKRHESRSTQD